MGEGINCGRAVEERGGAHEKAPDEQLRAVGLQCGGCVFEIATEKKQAGGEKHGHDDIIATQPNDFGILGEVFDLGVIGREVALAGYPTDMRPKKTVDAGRVGVHRFVRVLVMMTVMGSPPERAALDRGARPKCEQELAEARCAVGFVGKIAVQNAGNGKHADEVEGNGCAHSEPAPTHPDQAKTTEVQHDKGNATDKVDPIGLGADGFRGFEGVIGINPLKK